MKQGLIDGTESGDSGGDEAHAANSYDCKAGEGIAPSPRDLQSKCGLS
jgi:hypothetical protein